MLRRTQLNPVSLFLLAGALVFSVACGDDDGRGTDTGTGTDAGSDTATGGDTVGTDAVGTDTVTGTDAGTDTGGTDGGTGTCGPRTPCDPVTGTGCEEGMGCGFGDDGAGGIGPVCLAFGTLAAGADCTADTECQEGHICAGGSQVCTKVCCADSDCATGASCNTNLTAPGGGATGYRICNAADDCDPIAQTGCPGAEACYPAAGGAFDCASPADGAPGAACTFINDCAGGSTCIGTEGSEDNFCRTLCRPSASSCSDAEVCSPLRDHTDLGVCVPAA